MDFAAFRAAAADGDRAVLDLLRKAGEAYGAAIHRLHLMFDPARVILVGPLADLGELLLAPVGKAVRRRCEGRVPEIVCSHFGPYGGAFGAAALALQQWTPAR